MFEPDTRDPFALFAIWFSDAKNSEPGDATAMSVGTVDAAGRPSVRIVLLKSVDERGFVFFTNLDSRKGRELLANPSAALCFYWNSLGRQVRVEGPASRVTEADSDSYFASRARASQIGAWASEQSRPLDSRDALMAMVGRYEAEFDGRKVPRPSYWAGMRVTPLRIEFWQDGVYRLHDRFLFSRETENDAWTVTRLNP